MRVAEFLEMIEPHPGEERWELLDGEAVLMAPQNERHQTIVTNLLLAAGRLASLRDCRALPGLGILNETVDDYAPIPDVVVRCGPILDGVYARDPLFVAEVLSRSTMINDRGRKLAFYQTIESLRTILLVSQDEVRIEAWQRSGSDWTLDLMRSIDDVIEAQDLGSITVADVYRHLPGL
jgi:Uma2 family endonuclease